MAITTLGDNFRVIIEGGSGARFAGLAEAWAEGTLPGGAGTKSAKGWSEVSASEADAAALSAATAEAAAGPTFASTALGLAATTSGQAFAVDNGDGTVTVYLNSAGSAVAQRTLATTAALGASGGAGLVGFIQSGTGAVERTVQSKMREAFSAEDFGAVGDGTTDDTDAIQAMLNRLWNNSGVGGVGRLTPGKTYRITDTLIIGSFVRFDLNGAKILVDASDIPTIEASKEALTQSWSVTGPGIIEYATQQTYTQTNAVGIRCSTASVYSFNFKIGGPGFINIRKACTAIDSTPDTGSFAFVGEIDGILANDCAGWSMNMDCDTSTGGITNLLVGNIWALQTNGAEQPQSKGFRFRGVQGLLAKNLVGDHLQKEWLYAEGCLGEIEHLAFEGCEPSLSSGQMHLIATTNCKALMFHSIYGYRNTLTISGSGEIYIFRPDGGLFEYQAIDFKEFTFSDTSSGSIYTCNPTTGTRVRNDYFSQTDSTGTPVAENLADFDTVKKIELWNGDVRTDRRGTKTHTFGTSAPASGTWVRGDVVWNTDTYGNGVFAWVCASSGTPGSWLPVWLPAQGAAIPDASGGATVDTQARTAINALLAVLRAQSVIAT